MSLCFPTRGMERRNEAHDERPRRRIFGGFEEEERGDLPEAKLKKKGGGVGLVFFICIL